METMMSDTVETNEPAHLPPFLRFLTGLLDEANEIATEEDMDGSIEYEVIQINETLACVEAKYWENGDDPDDVETFRLFAAGQYRNQSMVNVERDGKRLLISAAPRALLAILSF